MIRLFIADDHQVLLEGFISIFDNVEDIEVVGTAQNGKEVLAYLKDNIVDAILLDINMPILNGVETCKKITKLYPEVKIIALSMYDQQSYFKRMIQVGAKGYLLKNDTSEEIEKAIRMFVNGGRYISSKMQSMLSSIDFISDRKSPLMGTEISPRELEVLAFLAEGLADQQIARKLLIAIKTVNNHRKSLLLKLDAKNTADLVRKAMKKGVI